MVLRHTVNMRIHTAQPKLIQTEDKKVEKCGVECDLERLRGPLFIP